MSDEKPVSVPPCVLCHAPAPEALTISLGGQQTRLWLCPQHRALLKRSFSRWLQDWIAHNGGDEARGDAAMRGETVDAPAGEVRRPRGRISYGWFATCARCEAVYDAGGAASVGVVAVHLAEAGWTQRDQATGDRRQAAEGTWICPVCAHRGDEARGDEAMRT
jgi:hypothetical protein